jgi:uncharacterized membrane protein YjjP (DUF1212 family)
MVSGGPGEARAPSHDALRADLAETKLLVHDLTKQLNDANARISAGAGANSVNEAVQKALDTQRVQRETIDLLTKEVNGLRQKIRLMEAHVDALTEQERELRQTFDQFFLWIAVGMLVFACVAAAELFGFVDVAGAFVVRKLKRWNEKDDGGEF